MGLQISRRGASSWASVVAGATASSQAPKAMQLSFIPPAAMEGRPRVLAEVVVSKEGAQLWAFTLVGHFVGSNLSFSAVRSIARSIWAKEGLQDVLTYEKGFYLFRFTTEARMKAILERGAWLFAGRYLVLMKWKPGLTLSRVTLHSIPFGHNSSTFLLSCGRRKG